jgi:hypothetical protein
MPWTKKIDTSDGKTYNVFERANGTVDVHEQNSGFGKGAGSDHGNYRSLADAVSAIEGKTGARVIRIR